MDMYGDVYALAVDCVYGYAYRGSAIYSHISNYINYSDVSDNIYIYIYIYILYVGYFDTII